MWSIIQFLCYDLPYFLYKSADNFKWDALFIFIVYQVGKISGMRLFKNFLESHFPLLKSEESAWKMYVNKQLVKLGADEFIPQKQFHGVTHSKRFFRRNYRTSSTLSQAENPQERRYKMKTFMCDAGHGGIKGTPKADCGAIGTSGRYEKDFNLYVVLKVQELLKDNPNVQVLLTRSTDVFLELKERTTLANKAKVDAFISFHANSFNPDSTGTETHYTSSNSKGLAEIMQKAQLQATGLKDRGLKKGNLYVTKKTKMPSCLLEPGYLSNPLEDALLFEPSFMDKYAECIAKGICEYFGVSYEVVPEIVIPVTPKGTTYVPAILGDKTFDGFISDGKSWIPAKEVLTFLNVVMWTFKGKVIVVNGTELETKIFNTTAYIKATDLKLLDILLNVMLDPDAVNTKRVLLYPKEVVQNG